MPKLSVHAKDVNVSIQDPFPTEGRLTMVIYANTTETKDISWPQLFRLRPQLTSLELANAIFYTVGTTELDQRADEPQLVGLPWVSFFDLQTIDHDGGETLNLYGFNLLGYQTKATSVMGDTTDTNGYIEFEAVVPGTRGDDISVEILDHTHETITVVGSKISMQINTGTSTYADVQTLFGTSPAALALATAAAHGTGLTLAAPEAELHLSEGQGAGMEVLIAEDACEIVSVSDNKISLTTPALSSAGATDMAIMSVRIAGQQQMYPVTLK